MYYLHTLLGIRHAYHQLTMHGLILNKPNYVVRTYSCVSNGAVLQCTYHRYVIILNAYD